MVDRSIFGWGKKPKPSWTPLSQRFRKPPPVVSPLSLEPWMRRGLTRESLWVFIHGSSTFSGVPNSEIQWIYFCQRIKVVESWALNDLKSPETKFFLWVPLALTVLEVRSAFLHNHPMITRNDAWDWAELSIKWPQVSDSEYTLLTLSRMIILLITPNTLDIYGTIYTLACRHGEITAGPRIHHSQCGRHSPCALREGPFEVAGNLSGSSGSSGTKNLCHGAKANSHVLLAGDFKGWLEVHGPSTESGYKKGTWTFRLSLVASHTGHGFAILKTWDLEGILRQPEVLARFFSMHLRTIYVTGKDGRLRSRLGMKESGFP